MIKQNLKPKQNSKKQLPPMDPLILYYATLKGITLRNEEKDPNPNGFIEELSELFQSDPLPVDARGVRTMPQRPYFREVI
jgi:hypothetical protein